MVYVKNIVCSTYTFFLCCLWIKHKIDSKWCLWHFALAEQSRLYDRCRCDRMVGGVDIQQQQLDVFSIRRRLHRIQNALCGVIAMQDKSILLWISYLCVCVKLLQTSNLCPNIAPNGLFMPEYDIPLQQTVATAKLYKIIAWIPLATQIIHFPFLFALIWAPTISLRPAVALSSYSTTEQQHQNLFKLIQIKTN